YRKAMAFFRIIACPATSVYIFPLCLSDSLLCSFISERPTRKCLSQFILNEKSRFLQFFLIDACLNTHSMQQIRSEEHTSELHSRFDLVCRLLLEKKKIK